jgi:hypothetical protein
VSRLRQGYYRPSPTSPDLWRWAQVSFDGIYVEGRGQNKEQALEALVDALVDCVEQRQPRYTVRIWYRQ